MHNILLHPPQERKRRAVNYRAVLRRLIPIATPLFLLLSWQALVMLKVYPTFIIPAPSEVIGKFIEVLNDGRWRHHTLVTLEEVLLGLLFGCGLAMVLGYVMAKSRLIDALISPVVVVLQATPIVAYAPLLIVWFGSGTMGKVVTCAVIVFFPMLMNTIVGIRQVPESHHDMLKIMNATRWQTFTKLEVPFALPVLLTGLKTSATLSIIGAVVGEFVSARAGLGFMVNQARNQYDTPLVFVGVFTMTGMALMLYSFVYLLEWRFLWWQNRT